MMQKLPGWAKWLILVAAMVGVFGVMWYVNKRAGEVEMPAPDSSFGAYHTPTATPAA